MPCRDGGGPGGTQIVYQEDPIMKAKRHKLARMLCTTLSNMSKSDVAKLPKEIRDWWIEHQAEDLERKRREADKQKQRRLKTQALGKLSSEEKKALGLKI